MSDVVPSFFKDFCYTVFGVTIVFCYNSANIFNYDSLGFGYVDKFYELKEKLMKELDLYGNIIWLGALSQNKLAEQYAKARVFVLCSAIENHSSSLKEAMMVGTPCVASAVGGVPEYVTHGENGFLYRFEEYDILAMHLQALFEDDALAQQMSEKAKKSIRNLHGEHDIYDTINDIMKRITQP